MVLQKTTIDFLKKLRQNNNKAWFDANRETYLAAKKDFAGLVDVLIGGILSFDRSVQGVTAKDCMFRINRDIRFSKDKSPYKTNFGADISGEGKKSSAPGYYIHVEPGNCFLAGGVYMPPAPQLHAIRQEIDYNTAEFKKMVLSREFKKYFGTLAEIDKLKTAPKGYPKDHPALEYLKHKSFIVVHEMKDGQVLNTGFVKHALKVWKALYPFNQFLQRATD